MQKNNQFGKFLLIVSCAVCLCASVSPATVSAEETEVQTETVQTQVTGTTISFCGYTIPVPNTWITSSGNTQDTIRYEAEAGSGKAVLTLEKLNIDPYSDIAALSAETERLYSGRLQNYKELMSSDVEICGIPYRKSSFTATQGEKQMTGSRLIATQSQNGEPLFYMEFVQPSDATVNPYGEFIGMVQGITAEGQTAEPPQAEMLEAEAATQDATEEENALPEDPKERAVLDANYLLDTGYYQNREELVQDLLSCGYSEEEAAYGADHCYVQWYDTPAEEEAAAYTEPVAEYSGELYQ